MSVRFDLHLHTRQYSRCSRIDPDRLLRQAEKVGLDGLVITEHHYQWHDDELQDLVARSGVPGLVVLAGFEYTSSQGDILIYGLEPEHAKQFKPGGAPESVVDAVRRLGGVCIAAHPTRAGMGFDERIYSMPLAAVEVCSVNLKQHERRLALRVAQAMKTPPVACSDAHDLKNVGRFVTEFNRPIQTRADLRLALAEGAFGLSQSVPTGTSTQ
jgi:hypothetical protein